MPHKTLFYYPCSNFGDNLNTVLFEKVFNVKFLYCTDVWNADFVAIGSVLDFSCIKNRPGYKEKLHYIIHRYLLPHHRGKLIVLGSGFNPLPSYKIRYARKMDFQIIRGKLTESYLRKNNILKQDVLLGDLGLLASYLCNCKGLIKKYKLGIIPHFMDLGSPVFYDIYKKYYPDCILINVNDDPMMIIKQIASCENIVSSAMHGLIVSDSLGIPNLWLENQHKHNYKNLFHFKYEDYYSVFDINNAEPMQAFDFLNRRGLNVIEESYRMNYEKIKAKQEELYDFCARYFNKIKLQQSGVT